MWRKSFVLFQVRCSTPDLLVMLRKAKEIADCSQRLMKLLPRLFRCFCFETAAVKLKFLTAPRLKEEEAIKDSSGYLCSCSAAVLRKAIVRFTAPGGTERLSDSAILVRSSWLFQRLKMNVLSVSSSLDNMPQKEEGNTAEDKYRK